MLNINWIDYGNLSNFCESSFEKTSLEEYLTWSINIVFVLLESLT